MKTQFLLPSQFKKLGLFMLVPFIIMGALEWFGGETLASFTYWEIPLPALYDDGMRGGQWFSVVKDSIYNEIWIIGLLLSLTFIALAKEKDEDEMISKIRLESMAWALWAIVMLFALETLWVFGFTYMESTFLTLFMYLILFIIKFNYEMYKLKRN